MSRGVATSSFRARYSETDQMGVVYHAHYLVWCEIARTELIRHLGTPYAELERAGVFLVVADAHVRYIAAARYDDWIRVEARLERVQSRAVTFAYEIAREKDGRLERLATATTKLIALDEHGSPRTLPTSLLRTFGDVLGAQTT
ncbi:MAG: acyl-CoA thioesterase [Longimicrobiales bacterium]